MKFESIPDRLESNATKSNPRKVYMQESRILITPGLITYLSAAALCQLCDDDIRMVHLEERRMAKKVVVDVDAGTDDAVALLLLLTLEHEKEYEVVGITCTHGNTTIDNVCRNVLKTLECINRLDVPVFRGAEGPLLRLEAPGTGFTYFHGKDGFGDKELPPPKVNIQRENAVVALNRIAAENNSIVLICLGPLTNLALALRTFPEFSNHLQEVHIMGGNVTAVGNTSPTAEFNFFKDPEAAHIVLSSLSCTVTILPWETCTSGMLPIEERCKNLGSIPTRQVKLLNEVEIDLYKDMAFWSPCDAILVATFVDEAMIKKWREVHMTVELHGVYTRGQGVVDHQRMRGANVRVVDKVSAEVFRKLVYKMASFVPKN